MRGVLIGVTAAGLLAGVLGPAEGQSSTLNPTQLVGMWAPWDVRADDPTAYIFEADGRVFLNSKDGTRQGSYSLNGERVTVRYTLADGAKKVGVITVHSVSADTLILTDLKGAKVKFGRAGMA